MEVVAISEGRTLVIGLNSALQRRVYFDALELGVVHTAKDSDSGIGGKGQDVFLASSCLKVLEAPKLLQFVGQGREGDQLLSHLQEIGKVDNRLSIRSRGKCRICTTLIETKLGRSTELIEPSANISEEEQAELLQSVASISEPIKALVIMGSMPPGCRQTLYSEIVRAVCHPQSLVLLDTVVGLPEVVQECNRINCQTLIKINFGELVKLYQQLSLVEASVSTMTDALQRAWLGEAYDRSASKLSWAITNGPDPSCLVTTDRKVYALQATELIDVRNAIGAGDTVAAGTIHYWTNNLTDDELAHMEETILPSKLNKNSNSKKLIAAFAFGLSCGAASCMQDVNSFLQYEDAKHIFSTMNIEAS